MSAAELFTGAGRHDGVEIWRIENMKPVKISSPTLGKFYSGDSYLILHTYTKAGAKAFNLHFWLGQESSQDERGAAAIFTAELDQFLGDVPVQFREVQGHESNEFLQIFKNGITYEEGGVASGFKKVDRDVFPKRLLHIKGHRNIRITQVPAAASSLNSGDCFVLDLGLTLYLWNGKSASRKEKTKMVDIAQAVNNEERGGRAKIEILEEGNETADFWTALGGAGPIASAASAGDDDVAVAHEPVKLYHVSDQGGELAVKEVGQRPLKRSMLDSGDVYILVANSAVYTWVGKSASAQEKKEATRIAIRFLAQNNLPDYTPIQTVKEGTETPLFKQNFSEWEAPRSSVDFSKSTSTSRIAKTKKEDVDVGAVFKGSAQEQERMVDDGTGKMKVWRIENFQKVEWPQEKYGQFYAGDSFIVLYSYMKGSKEEHIIYFWQGTDSSTDERGASALLAQQLDDEMGGSPVQCRVVMNKEPNHFYALFKGKMMVHSGGMASAFKNAGDSDSYDTDGVYLYHVRGTNDLNTRAVQVEEKATALNSTDCFVLVAYNKLYVWRGQFSTDTEKAYADNVAKLLQKGSITEVKQLNEGEEDDEFWSALGGKQEYPQASAGTLAPRDARLFQVSNSSGNLKVEEIFNFSQEDLDENDVMLLDTYSEVYVWLGRDSNDDEKKGAVDIAYQYIQRAAGDEGDGREWNCPVVKVDSGSEPSFFTCHFIGWTERKVKAFVDPYQARLQKLKEDTKAPEAQPEFARRASQAKPFNDPLAAKEKAKEPSSEETPEFLAKLKKKDVFVDPYQAKLEKLKQDNPEGEPEAAAPEPAKFDPSAVAPVHIAAPRADDESPAPAPSAAESESEDKVTVPIGAKNFSKTEILELKRRKSIFNEVHGLEATRLEQYLPDDEFKAIFKCTRDEFNVLPKWKQMKLKKDNGFF
eukprot:TRINITY_DN2282_c0_g1::TRINITY_DN2282_c0_g1_i1::g.6847::m.6847 TRINITY_DN2282_c0_g1::TRINITY_DN2282_c0_g1_i1::g.6847  ORF type:complete len:944 (-),score=398.86,sp/P02640/VILI_CHICK/39.83/3e-174,sp/P02640/VILI_CHICK/32.63/2e-39,sp/P02640/VILI_CHICK/28.42/2e-32,Gelsolin/PF00626.17/1.1e-18,Gelsolin/PF00626.17/1.8e-16,Gelsolin/PF00626.17/1e-09,Gelsolin/PF00626.17/6.1e-17,Gelsolin/PF00626.17/2.5e-07,Gelsolin/PF00626.17/1.7e-10,VHP/PF02209.14/9.4e+03,VHP/PF02209.14/2.6e-14 TRINITY_DN2282_c0_g1_i1:633-